MKHCSKSIIPNCANQMCVHSCKVQVAFFPIPLCLLSVLSFSYVLFCSTLIHICMLLTHLLVPYPPFSLHFPLSLSSILHPTLSSSLCELHIYSLPISCHVPPLSPCLHPFPSLTSLLSPSFPLHDFSCLMNFVLCLWEDDHDGNFLLIK